ncbi:MAG: hypothetical protein KGJ90_00395 [Patescibacteria group bacterium]|nr:hypothetical protein [Patescibacteria group bacterium]
MQDYQLTSGDQSAQEFAKAQAIDGMQNWLRNSGLESGHRDFLLNCAFMGTNYEKADVRAVVERLHKTAEPANALAKAFRSNVRYSRGMARMASLKDLYEQKAISKADLDVGTLTNFAQITGGQSLGYVSLDTQMARGTARPNSFTLYQCLKKSGAYQVVDYWPYAQSTGGGLAGTAFQGFSNVASGTLATSAGVYALQNITLKLAVNGRAITTALAAQNSFVDVTAQENINAALTILESEDWTCYWGNPTLFPNQFTGIYNAIPSGNIFDWYQFTKNPTVVSNGWSNAQTLFNLIYEASAQITSYRNYGRITHAFMTPTTAGSLQGLVTNLLNNIVTVITPSQERLHGIVVDGDLQGMRTRFGEIQFPIDLFISARDKPAQAIVYENGTNGVTSSVTAPTSVAAAVSGANAGSAWDSTYVASSGLYAYAVAALDSNMNESALTYLSGSGAYAISISGIAASGAYTLTIVPNGTGAAAFRVYRSGLGYNPATSGATNPASFRAIGTVAASGASNVTFTDLNTTIPGSETIFLLDMDENDGAIDYRYLLPLTKIDLFAQNLFMPWAVAMIGAIRVKIPKFHGAVKNYVPDNPTFNPLTANVNAV